MGSPDILTSHPLVEQILDAHRDPAGGDDAGFAGYKGHVYRVLNFTRVLLADEAEEYGDRLAIAAAVHDLEAQLAGLSRAVDPGAGRLAGAERPTGLVRRAGGRHSRAPSLHAVQGTAQSSCRGVSQS